MSAAGPHDLPWITPGIVQGAEIMSLLTRKPPANSKQTKRLMIALAAALLALASVLMAMK